MLCLISLIVWFVFEHFCISYTCIWSIKKMDRQWYFVFPSFPFFTFDLIQDCFASLAMTYILMILKQSPVKLRTMVHQNDNSTLNIQYLTFNSFPFPSSSIYLTSPLFPFFLLYLFPLLYILRTNSYLLYIFIWAKLHFDPEK